MSVDGTVGGGVVGMRGDGVLVEVGRNVMVAKMRRIRWLVGVAR